MEDIEDTVLQAAEALPTKPVGVGDYTVSALPDVAPESGSSSEIEVDSKKRPLEGIADVPSKVAKSDSNDEGDSDEDAKDDDSDDEDDEGEDAEDAEEDAEADAPEEAEEDDD